MNAMRQGRSPPRAAAHQLVVRVDGALLAALDKAVAAERRQHPGERWSRSDEVRRLLARALLAPAEGGTKA